MTRPTDALKETRSYVVQRDPNTKAYFVKASHWQPGYTPAYCETKLEALDYMIEEAEKTMLEAQAVVIELHDLRATIAAGVG